MALIDPQLMNTLVEFVHPGHCVWDIGANVGYGTFGAAHLVGGGGSVLAVEPDTWLVSLLRSSANSQPNSSGNVTVLAAAVASECGVRTFSIASRSRATNSLAEYGTSQTGGVAETQTVVTLSLDWLRERFPAPQFLKIDVEGAELEVLRGATSILRRDRPVILCEIGEACADAVSALLRDAGYELFDAENHARPRSKLLRATWNTLAIPNAGRS